LKKEATTWGDGNDQLVCERRNIDANGTSATFRLRHDPVMLNQRFFSVRFSFEVECGSTMQRGSDIRLFDRASGEQADPALWFTSEMLRPVRQASGATVAIPDLELAGALQSLAGGSKKKCLFDPLVQFPAYITVVPNGFAFERADLNSGDCEPVVLPWLRAAPMLNLAGRAVFLDLARKKFPGQGADPSKPPVEF
jgi:hypothetical protein